MAKGRTAPKPSPLLVTNAPPRGEELQTVVANVAKAMVGAGALLMPACYARVGLLYGLLFSAVAGLLTAVTLLLTARAGQRTGARDYLGLAAACGLSSRTEALVTALIAVVVAAPVVVTVQQTTAYAVAALAALFDIHMPFSVAAVVLSLLVLWPTALIADRRVLARASQIGMAGMLYVLVLAFSDALFSTHSTSWHWAGVPHSASTAVRTLTMMVFSLSCHLTLPALVRPMHDRTAVRELHAVSTATLLASLFQAVVGTAGYVVFGASVPSDVLAARPAHPAYVAGMLAIVVVNAASFPLVVMPVRSTLRHVRRRLGGLQLCHEPALYGRISLSAVNAEDSDDDAHEMQGTVAPMSGLSRRRREALYIVAAGCVASFFLSGMAAVFDVVGAIVTGPLFVSLPAYMCLSSVHVTGRARVLLSAIFLLGVVFGLVSILALIL